MKRALLLLAACGGAKPAPSPAPAPAPARAEVPPADAPAPKQEEILAAIQKAMTDLDPAAHACWAAAATERFDIAGDMKMHVDVGDGTAIVMIGGDTTNSKRLGSCMIALLTNYRWAPPLKNQSIELPFQFSAPDSQSVIDRRLVEAHAQGDVAIATLLDENNTGNPHASMFEVTIKQGGTTGYRQTERAELWFFLTKGNVSWGPSQPKPLPRHVDAGDMMFVPAGGVRTVWATTELHAVIVAVPGGREGSARAGALPTPDAHDAKVVPTLLPASAAKKFGPATIYLDNTIVKKTPMSGEILEMAAGTKVPEHVHANETELLYVLEGSGTMTIAGTDVPVTATSVIQIPPNTKHAFVAKQAVRSLQVYTPAGPEQRFKKR